MTCYESIPDLKANLSSAGDFDFSLLYARARKPKTSPKKIHKTSLQDSLVRGSPEGESRHIVSDSKKRIYYDYGARLWRGIKQADVDFWTDAYDGVNVVAELKKMKGWLDAHPKKIDFKRFITNWLSKSQDHSRTFAGARR